MKHWVETYPHTIFASVLLLDNKIENWKVGERKWEYPFDAKAHWKMDRLNDYQVQNVGWTVYTPEAHSEVFNIHAPFYFKQWEIADDFRGHLPYEKDEDNEQTPQAPNHP